MMFRSLFSVSWLVVAVAASSSSNLRGKETDNQDRHLSILQTITSIVNSNSQFDTLETALKTTGLNKTLAGAGPFTVFAPTDSAFAKLGQSTIASLLRKKEYLSDILLYHVVPGKILRKDLTTEIINAANGDNLAISTRRNSSEVRINRSLITKANVEAKNGIIHFIDRVLIPPKDLVDKIKSDSRLTTLATAIKAAKLESVLKSNTTDYTIFAPTNRAFQALGADTLDALLKAPATLKSILLYHAVKGSVLKSTLDGQGSVKTVQGSNIQYDGRTQALFINDAEVTEANILSANGLIHIIDTVLTLP